MKTDNLFIPAQAGRAGEDVALQLEVAILSDKIVPGESLPSERDLQTQFQTGRGVIREAIRALKQKGLIEIRKGAKGGAYVKRIEVSNASESLALFLKQNHVDPAHIVEFRESIDQQLSILAIARAEETEKKQLVAQTEELQREASGGEPDLEKLGEIDRELNIRLAKMSRNPIFAWVMEALQLGFSSHDHTLYSDPNYCKKTVDNWHITANYIAANEPLLAQASISTHYQLLRHCLDDQGILCQSRNNN
ncbi:MAG: GntR family transcriptional regulator [Thermodesulfobacteriota bacterium]|nr:GntR family transcriptional regulator [Thermodesulfobacteriota bacterium]